MKRIFLLFLVLTISIVSFGQDKPASEIPSGPSMKETQAWIKRELPLLGSYSKVTGRNGDPSFRVTFKYGVESAVLEDCRLSLRWTLDADYSSRQTFTNTVTLKDVDVRKVSAVEEPVATGFTQSRPSYIVLLTAAADRGDPFTSQIKREGKPAGDMKPTREVSVRAGDKEGADRAAEVFRRAAVLCGAPNQPALSQTSKPTSPAESKITNDEVIQLVAAGLSEQVIITSIRQAPTKDFDLTPTGLIALKKANVPDAVIAVMQEKDTTKQTPATSDAKTPPKYDATLEKPPAPPASQDRCSGIESMGIFKNTAIDPAIGGGVVEWLAKIRNNTNVTKIVIFGWIDMYGQQQKAQVQIRGGDIASVRLDLTQARVIPPVRELRVLSCQ